jgi:hypothetical protein
MMQGVETEVVDEAATATNMTKRYGRDPSYQRLVATVPHGQWRTTTFHRWQPASSRPWCSIA